MRKETIKINGNKVEFKLKGGRKEKIEMTEEVKGARYHEYCLAYCNALEVGSVGFDEKQFDIEKYIIGRFQKYGKDLWKPEKKFSEMTLSGLRSYVTMFIDLHYSSKMPIKVEIPYDEEVTIEDDLNKEFDKRVGKDFLALYNLYDKHLNKSEKWSGEIKYRLFSYKVSGHSYSEMSNFYTAYKLLWFAKEKGIKVEDIVEMFTEFSYPCYWELDEDKDKDHALKTAIIKQIFSQNYDKKLL